jgi:hypothetical protein
MADFKEKTQTFIFGMLVGLVIAGSFFIFKLDNYIEKLKLYKNITKTFYLHTSKNKMKEEVKFVETTEEINSNSEAYKKEKKRIKNSNGSKKLLSSTNDTATVFSVQDSIAAIDFFESEKNNIVIEKDEQVSSSILEITNLNRLSSNEHASDSILQKLSGIRDDKNFAKRTITVELWKSPLHYKGYKMTKNKLILYGFPSADGIKLFKLDDVVYMKISSSAYILEQTYEYKPYQHVDDLVVIGKLK